jgi:hypothetical protein
MPSPRILLGILILAGALVVTVQTTASAAAPVLVMDRHGDVHARIDRALPPDAGWPVERARPRGRAAASRPRTPRARTVRSELKRLLAAGEIDVATQARHRRLFDDAIRTARRLSGMRRAELQGVIANLHGIAARGGLTTARLPALFETLERNVRWWTTGSLLSSGQRVEFSDSELVWQYYPGEGIELQVLGTFGKANGLWMAGDDEGLRALLDEMIGLAAERGGALAWEYYFDFGGGTAPWTSAMSQATGIQALSRAAERLHDPAYLAVAQRALRIFSIPAPTGVRVRTRAGARYVIYSYAPSQAVVNAFVQTLVGLHDYAQIAGDAAAQRLFRAGDRQARLDVRAADTGAWSLYQVGGAESDLGYHLLLRDFLRNLCARVAVQDYCGAATTFTRYLNEPPELTLVTERVRARRYALVRFAVSKVSRVGMTIRYEGRSVLSTSASVSRGDHAYGWTVPRRAGTYDVTLSGTDLAGNPGRAAATIEVLPARRPARARARSPA